jgi:hypothetical protein
MAEINEKMPALIASTSNISINEESKSNMLGYFLPDGILFYICSQLLLLDDVFRFDSAICNRKRRPSYLGLIGSESCVFMGHKDRVLNSFAVSWLQNRSIRIRHLKCLPITDSIASKVGEIGNCLHWLSMGPDVTDAGVISVANGCPNLHTISLSGCPNVTDISVIKIAGTYPNLRSLDLTCCFTITNASIIKLAEGCPHLHSLHFDGCNEITDISIIRIAEVCPDLQSIL